MPYSIYTTPEYEIWFQNQTTKEQAQIVDRLSKVEDSGYFGDHKRVDEYVYELKWINGRRLYFAYI